MELLVCLVRCVYICVSVGKSVCLSVCPVGMMEVSHQSTVCHMVLITTVFFFTQDVSGSFPQPLRMDVFILTFMLI